MATIVLSSLGSLFGPVGQIAGTLAGNAIDNAIFAPDDIEGARLKELAVTGSSYGTPIARHHGAMRASGTVIWSTDLTEHRDRQGNGKGRPKTVSYSYSVSFAVALSSRPIDRVGRIWADGNLLRGAGGDLKSGGQLRVYQGHGDQPRDPLIEADLGNRCPAFRGCAYAVFEDLDLTDFGNRIPSLSFEIFAGDGGSMVEAMLQGHDIAASPDARFAELRGFAHEGGSLRDVLRLVDKLHPLAPRLDGDGLTIASANAMPVEPLHLPPATAWEEGDFGPLTGFAKARADTRQSGFAALRYYDPARDYQPGLQHADGSEGDARIFQFPGVFAAGDASTLARRANYRAAVKQDSLSWRCAELDPAIGPGSLVTAPGFAGIWLVAGWEWRERGIEMELVRHRPSADTASGADPGSAWMPPDRLPGATQLRVFETPWDGIGSSSTRRVYAAAGAASGRWAGCALYAQRDGALLPLGRSATERAVTGHLPDALAPSSALRFEPHATLRLQLLDRETEIQSTDLTGLAQGENRLLVGEEVLQFANAHPLGEGLWGLTGLLRGRGGTEIEAAEGHAPGAQATLLDERLTALDDDALALASTTFAALDPADDEPALAELENAQASLRPPCPVHGTMAIGPDGVARFEWKRRARGQWRWLDTVDQPLVEETEAYEIGFGPVDAPHAIWTVDIAQLKLPADEMARLRSAHGAGAFWVRQLGSFARSRAALLGQFS